MRSSAALSIPVCALFQCLPEYCSRGPSQEKCRTEYVYVGSTMRCQEHVLISTCERSVLISQRRAQKGLDKTERSHRKAGLIDLTAVCSFLLVLIGHCL